MIRSAEEFRSLRLSERRDEYLRAAQEEAPLEVWVEVCARWPELRFWVAQNKTVPQEILVRLADDDDPKVRGMVARKRKLNPSLQANLVRDPDASVRASLAQNPKLLDEFRGLLLEDPEGFVREAARRDETG